MILSELRDYLKTNQRAALIDLSHRFDADPDALRGMLDKWVAKGKVEKLPQGSPCGGGCCKCDPATTEIYEWVG
ncbi:FeoC-like transcriptional regulator [Sedimenticola thiotaurini]|uniref:Sugar metabolism transcriptional regulator n=1 Tax=Sedimenticola thiotaurini TaxID=1543721 RepID=A0A0F7JZ29_9GAMM|nr:FeoC-like transcriptional regulator [Sedimenticola thiotaurini]AKH20145.1 sugar metabolism transcriptional regulator [Sedimenticola thiotaurini]